jgi:NAD(P)-dependent dehydrogenase (short-subunit alcohol dehydrogenase family)
MLLQGKSAIVYGGGGAVGGAVSRVFAREGARVFLAGRTAASLEAVANVIRAAGGAAETAVVDALDERAVDAHADAVAAAAGGIDVSFCLVSQGDVQGTPLAEMTVADLMSPVETTVRAMFITARAAARHMMRQRSGVILAFGGYGDPTPNVGGLQLAFGAAEALRRGLARELAAYGIRVLTIQTGGIPESIPPDMEGAEAITEQLVGATMLGRTATLEDVGNVAAFAASDLARSMTATKLNITCGSEVD